MRKNDDDLTLRLLSLHHALNGNLVPSMHNLSALKEIRSPADKREFHDTTTGMRDFMGAVQELDEVWRAIFNSGLIKPAARCQPGGVRVADVSLAQYEDYQDEEAFLAASGARQVFTFPEIMEQSQCWNCRGLGHVRSACPSSDGLRSIAHAISALDASTSYRGGKSKGKGKGEVRLSPAAGQPPPVSAVTPKRWPMADEAATREPFGIPRHPPTSRGSGDAPGQGTPTFARPSVT